MCCPICGGNLEPIEQGVICDTCSYSVDNQGNVSYDEEDKKC